ncbi:MAG: EamA family transporter [Thermomicrobiales bacterium]|nr:EamA family transporter [Thermomicrobiales bacterium]
MSRRGLVLFSLMGVIWGMPYLFIKEAVASLSPASVVSVRTLGAALLLLPLAAHQGALRPAFRHWRWVLAFGLIEMAGPFMLLSSAEQTLPSSVTGLLVSTVPLVAAVIAFTRGDRSALQVRRVAGLAIGIAGVALVVSGGSDGSVNAIGVIMVLLTAVCYAIAPFVVATHLRDVPALGSISVSMAAVGIGYLPIALATQDGSPTARSVAAVVALTVLCTAVAFVVFFALIAEVGPAKATLFTYVNPVVALGLGVIVLDEQITGLMLAGVPLILIGCWLATQSGFSRSTQDPVELVPADGA